MDELQHIIAAATQAPSGENCQPWQFKKTDQKIFLYNDPEKDNSLYSWGQRASYLANGAALENMLIAAAHYGLAATVRIFPDQAEPELVAVLDVQKGETASDPLFLFIAQRASNRKPYAKQSLTAEQKGELERAGNSIPGANFYSVDNVAAVSHLASMASINERILFENRALHEFFFHHINWTKEEEQTKRFGFYTKTLELPPPVLGVFQVCRHWTVQRILNAIGMSRLIAKANEQIYKTASVMGAIAIPDDSKVSYVAAGRALERVWLTATRLGLSMQLMTGCLFLNLKIKHGDTAGLAAGQAELAQRAYREISRCFAVPGDKTVALLFRIGCGGQPSAHATKLPPKIIP